MLVIIFSTRGVLKDCLFSRCFRLEYCKDTGHLKRELLHKKVGEKWYLYVNSMRPYI